LSLTLASALAATTALAAATLTTALTASAAAHLGDELLKLGLLVGSHDFHDRFATRLAILDVRADLLNLLQLVGSQSQLGVDLLHALAALASVGSSTAVSAPIAIASHAGVGLGRRGLGDGVGVS
jgi:hypothetical protein